MRGAVRACCLPPPAVYPPPKIIPLAHCASLLCATAVHHHLTVIASRDSHAPRLRTRTLQPGQRAPAQQRRRVPVVDAASFWTTLDV